MNYQNINNRRNVLQLIAGGVASLYAAKAMGDTLDTRKDRGTSDRYEIYRDLILLSGREWVSIEDFAQGDDLTRDASPAIGRMLRSKNQRGGLCIKLKPKSYGLTQPLVIEGENNAIVGAGFKDTILRIDHNQGHGLIYTGTGDTIFSDFSILRSSPINSSPDENASGFISDPGATQTTLRLMLINVFSSQHQGHGLHLINPELALVGGCGAAYNHMNGLYLHGRNLENIENQISRVRLRNNRLAGLLVEGLSANILEQIECLNNLGEAQLAVVGNHNRIIQPDLEAFEIASSTKSGWAMTLNGGYNLVEEANIYRCKNGIRLKNASFTRVISPDIKGTSSDPVEIGISVGEKTRDVTISGVRTVNTKNDIYYE